jgi:hypothetical protein
VTATPAEPRFDAGPPSSPPPAHAPGQRRFNFLVVGLTILLAAVLVASLVVYNRHGPKPAAVNQTATVVQQAFLTYYSALEEAYRQQNLDPLLGLVTSAGLKQEQGHMAVAVGSGSRYQFTADHDLQVAVYSPDLASVDDVLVRHTAALDPTSLVPIGTESTDTLHASYGFKKEGGHWLLDSVSAFGQATPSADLPVSYAAVSRGRPMSTALRSEVEQAYLRYWMVSASAFKSMDSSTLASVEADPELSKERSALERWREQKRSYRIDVQHNYRIAMRDGETAFVYDTLRDSSYLLDVSTGKPVPGTPSSLLRQSFELKMFSGQWKVDLVSLL